MNARARIAMSPNRYSRNRQSGVALLFALLTLLVLSTLAAALIFATEAENWSSSNYQRMLQARYAAEAGAQNTLNWLVYNYSAPTMSAYDTTKYPVQDAATHNTVILSAMTGVTANYPDATVQTAFSAALKDASVPGVGIPASYEVTATLLNMTPGGAVSWLGGTGGAIQTWQITSQGNVPGIRNAQVQVVMNIQRTGTPVFSYAVAATSSACKAINFAGTDYTDSYNSSNGPYSVTNSQASGGNIAANGNVTLGSSAAIKGTISAPNITAGACPAGITSSGTYSGTSRLSANLTFPLPWGCSTTPCYPPPVPPATTLLTTAQDVSTSCSSVSGCTKNSPATATIFDNGRSTTVNVFTLTPGDYGNLQIDNADVVHLSAGTYDLNSLNFAKDGQIVVDSGPVVLNVAGQGYDDESTVVNAGGLSGWNLCSGGITGNPAAYGAATCGSSQTAFSGIPANLQIVYAGAATISSTGAPVASAIYAPNALVETTGAAVGMYGSIISNTFLEGSKAPVHYDNALANVMVAGPYYSTSFSWSKF